MTAAVSGFTTTDRVEISAHARDRWANRTDHSVAVDDAWRAAEPISWPGPHNALYARYHAPSGLVLIVQDATVVTACPVGYVATHGDRLYADLKQVAQLSGGGDD